MLKFRRLVLVALVSGAVAGGAVGQPAPSVPASTTISATDRQAALAAIYGSDEFESAAKASDESAFWAALVRYARRESGQRIRSREVDSTWTLQGGFRDIEREMRQAREQGRLGAFLQGLAPQSSDYRQLMAARDRYRALVAMGGWGTIPAGKPPVLDAEDAQVPALRARLAAEAYVAQGGDSLVFDAELQQGLIEYQRRNGLEPDGKLGPESRRALNMSAAERLTQIEVNLERRRWLPVRLPDARLDVDVARAEATLYEAGQPELGMRIVVGAPKTKTPLFASRLQTVVFNPPWNVPDSIATGEILPKAARNPGYLAANDYVWVDGRLQQKPGEKNALGQIKFDLPSPFGVYLHDTPGKSAFSRRVRTLSHGCMRLEKPHELAQILLGRQGWNALDIQASIDAGVTRRVDLKTPVPLYVTYTTAFVDETGALRFVPDVYGWDAKLAAALAAAR